MNKKWSRQPVPMVKWQDVMKSSHNRASKGFTLIELLVVMGIIGVLAG